MIQVRFEEVDGFATDALRALSPTGRYSLFGIDLSGKAQLHLILRLIRLYLREFPGCRMMVKNEALFRALQACTHAGAATGDEACTHAGAAAGDEACTHAGAAAGDEACTHAGAAAGPCAAAAAAAGGDAEIARWLLEVAAHCELFMHKFNKQKQKQHTHSTLKMSTL